MANVTNEYDVIIDFDAAVYGMDDDIREELSRELAGEVTEQEFFDAYCAAHAEKFGDEWELAKPNPVW